MQMLRDSFLHNILEVYFGMDIKKIETVLLIKNDHSIEKHVSIRFKNGEKDTVRAKQQEKPSFEWSYYRSHETLATCFPRFLFGMRLHSGDYLYFVRDSVRVDAVSDFMSGEALQSSITCITNEMSALLSEEHKAFDAKRDILRDFYRPYAIQPEKSHLDGAYEVSTLFSLNSYALLDGVIRCMDCNCLSVHYPGYALESLNRFIADSNETNLLFGDDHGYFAARCELLYDLRQQLGEKFFLAGIDALLHE